MIKLLADSRFLFFVVMVAFYHVIMYILSVEILYILIGNHIRTLFQSIFV